MKRYGLSQNFLHSSKLVFNLIDKANFLKQDLILDIGAGTGIITDNLKGIAASIHAIEPDNGLYLRLINKFSQAPNIKLVNKEFKEYILPNQDFKVFANIPFNYTSQILKKILNSANFKAGYFVLQKEAAFRFSQKSFIHIIYSIDYEFNIIHKFKPSDFKPQPKVDVVLLKITRRPKMLIESNAKNLFLDFVAFIFTMSNPNLDRSLKMLFTKKQLQLFRENLGIDKHTKLIDLNPEAFVYFFTIFTNNPQEKKLKVSNFYKKYSKNQSKLKKVFRTRR